jgi:hypothetical protein
MDPQDLHGVEAIKKFAAEFRKAFHDFPDSIINQIAEGGMYTATVIASGEEARAEA